MSESQTHDMESVAEIARLRQRILDDNKAYGCELRDPNGTIWEHAAWLQEELTFLRNQLADLRESHAADKIAAEAVVCGLRQKLAEARAVIDKLPKTADGMPAYPGMNLYRYNSYTNMVCDAQCMYLSVSDLYSTREAAGEQKRC